ncbi:MAG: DUF2950 domain-containing protein [Candidatus Korobacteraceae bacterium]
MTINCSLSIPDFGGTAVQTNKMSRHLKLAAVTFFVLALSLPALAQGAGEKTFATPQDASKALYEAAKAGDTQAVVAVLGPASESIIHSGDTVQDKKNLTAFLARYEQMSRVGRQTDGSRVLYLGADNWPFPIPLKQTASHKWYFDSAVGKQEILFRRIGKNELAAIRVLNALVDAQREYYDGTHDGATHQYAARIMSTPDKQDGLYWKVAEGEPQSPIGPVVAYATNEGYGKENEGGPFHGYFYRTLKGQGANAPGGAKLYAADGKITGFAFIAYPAEYRNSGVMTFLVDTDGVIYEKDLGANTSTVAPAITSFNPDKSWTPIPADEGEQDVATN